MAVLRVMGDELVLQLTGIEQAEAAHASLRAPLTAIRGVEILEDAHAPADRGLKVGTRIPGYIEVGTIHADGHKIFAVVHKNTPRGLLIWLEGTSHDQWIVGCADPETVASSLGLLG
ncbi:MAG TPA: hypothetical protein VN767_24565 [Streptosporangiaceae bacterium]|jgi:hypothetical protein|nr:hypothetical protein [Streptosporangiaceae bacterium]